MRKLFEVPNDAETRLWKLDGKDSFTRLRCLGKTATEAGLESILRSPTLVLETKIDGKWERTSERDSIIDGLKSELIEKA